MNTYKVTMNTYKVTMKKLMLAAIFAALTAVFSTAHAITFTWQHDGNDGPPASPDETVSGLAGFEIWYRPRGETAERLLTPRPGAADRQATYAGSYDGCFWIRAYDKAGYFNELGVWVDDPNFSPYMGAASEVCTKPIQPTKTPDVTAPGAPTNLKIVDVMPPPPAASCSGMGPCTDSAGRKWELVNVGATYPSLRIDGATVASGTELRIVNGTVHVKGTTDAMWWVYNVASGSWSVAP